METAKWIPSICWLMPILQKNSTNCWIIFFSVINLYAKAIKKGKRLMKEHTKSKMDKGKMATRILAGILAALMLLGSVGTLLYYIFA